MSDALDDFFKSNWACKDYKPGMLEKEKYRIFLCCFVQSLPFVWVFGFSCVFDAMRMVLFMFFADRPPLIAICAFAFFVLLMLCAWVFGLF